MNLIVFIEAVGSNPFRNYVFVSTYEVSLPLFGNGGGGRVELVVRGKRVDSRLRRVQYIMSIKVSSKSHVEVPLVRNLDCLVFYDCSSFWGLGLCGNPT